MTVLTANLIQGETPLDNILSFYKEANAENVTRLLVRCKKMYDARVDVKKILYQIIMVSDLCQTLKRKRDIALEDRVLQLLRKLISQLSNFKHENKMFKAKFIFDGIDKYSDCQELEDAILSGEFYVERVKEPPKKEMKEQHTSITPQTKRSEASATQVNKAVIAVPPIQIPPKEEPVRQVRDSTIQTEDIQKASKLESPPHYPPAQKKAEIVQTQP